MSRELVLCILVVAYNEIQTAQFNDVAQFGNIESFSKIHFGKRGKSSLEELRACRRDHGTRRIVEETVSPGSNHGLELPVTPPPPLTSFSGCRSRTLMCPFFSRCQTERITLIFFGSASITKYLVTIVPFIMTD